MFRFRKKKKKEVQEFEEKVRQATDLPQLANLYYYATKEVKYFHLIEIIHKKMCDIGWEVLLSSKSIDDIVIIKERNDEFPEMCALDHMGNSFKIAYQSKLDTLIEWKLSDKFKYLEVDEIKQLLLHAKSEQTVKTVFAALQNAYDAEKNS